MVIATHAHSDHMAGLIPVIQSFPIKIITQPGYKKDAKFYQEFVKAANDEPNCKYYPKMIPDLVPKEGDLLNWSKELEVTVLNSNPKVNEETVNNSSIVIKIAYGKVSLLLMGDAEGKNRNDSPKTIKYVEKHLVDKYGNILESTVLKVAHHGSETSTTLLFLDKVKPKYAIISAGNKKFGSTLLPDETVIARLEQNGIKIFRTYFDDQDKSWQDTPADDHIQVVIVNDSILKIGYLN
jgi:competence protein ComEC